ncbi:MAG: hypothetical protein RJA76_1784 [Bacteroidota bacterium]|mgnify:CR=1 FL=1|jgi:hypothetical protein|uniref:P-loop NTPase fold protein n=1 Tax=Aquirufa novilacunae TaxID=3139305 RepID=A0ABW8U1V0_9BACT
MGQIRSNIVDRAISKKEDDLLKVEKYSIALSNFISNSDTPITIGLQGEWGTGKTSLMALLYEDFNQRSIACSWVNTWEYSMFRGPNETTPGVLKAMMEKLEQTCRSRGLWSFKDENEKKFKKATRFLGNITNQILSNQIGVDFKSALGDNQDSNTVSTIEIAEIKSTIASLISELINDPKVPLDRVVFFVDDLDRIPPSDAVEILEALKNIFDIPHCIFVLAIDYEVVVKGLESKFGPKTEENEREFRSFFDKIIQVPFSMPTGTYDIENFLLEKFNSLGIEINISDKELFTKAVRLSIGSNPRSLKRYLNSFSLINHLKAIDKEENQLQGDDFMLFVLLGIQISYPKIFRLITQKNNFCEWNRAFASKIGIDLDDVKVKITKFGETELLDEEWEQVVWGACQMDSYLKSRAFSVIELLNLVRSKYTDNLEEELENAIAFASITSVDDNMETKFAVQKIGNKTVYSGLETKISQLQEEGLPKSCIDNYLKLWSPLNDFMAANEHFRISFAKTGSSFNNDAKVGRGNQQLIYSANPNKKTGGITFWVKNNSGKTQEMYQKLKVDFDLIDCELISINESNDLVLDHGLSPLLKGRYEELLNYIVNEIVN